MHPLFGTFSRQEYCPTSDCRASIADDDPGAYVTGMLKIMIIRHAEKHQHGSHDRGVNEYGRPAHHELTVRGWQRAGALVHLFALRGGPPVGCRIDTPRSIFASDATRDSPSLRAMHTVGPLAAALGLTVNHEHAEEEEAALAAAVLAAPSPALIVWHHGAIPRLVWEIAGKLPACPVHWPDDRFDLIWILEREAPRAGWSFSQVTQQLLPGDGTDGVPP
jgi:broad specificity phosphatase PhoE